MVGVTEWYRSGWLAMQMQWWWFRLVVMAMVVIFVVAWASFILFIYFWQIWWQVMVAVWWYVNGGGGGEKVGERKDWRRWGYVINRENVGKGRNVCLDFFSRYDI